MHASAPTDRRIDRLVYELYGLTDAEIRIVEEATRWKLADWGGIAGNRRALKGIGRGWIRTSEGERQRVYSPSPLATWVHALFVCRLRGSRDLLSPVLEVCPRVNHEGADVFLRHTNRPDYTIRTER